MARTLGIIPATIIGVILVVVSTIIWFAQGGTATFDRSDAATFFVLAAVFLAVVSGWYILPKDERRLPKDERRQ
jgi:hypothetical protein